MGIARHELTLGELMEAVFVFVLCTGDWCLEESGIALIGVWTALSEGVVGKW